MNRNLDDLDPELRKIVNKILKLIDKHQLPFRVFETLRSEKRQKILVKRGYSKTLKSKHLPNCKGKSEAIDFVVYRKGRWTWDDDIKYWYDILGILVTSNFENVRWGGHFHRFYDGSHFELKL
jgi:hypothetical protein